MRRIFEGTFFGEVKGSRVNLLDLRKVRRNSIDMTFQSFSPIQVSGAPMQVAFHRTELAVILSLYGRMVAAGEWRDYGISCLRDVAVFSIFRRTAENPLYRIEKRPKLCAKQGQYAVIGIDGQVLKRGHDLKSVLRALERKLIRAVQCPLNASRGGGVVNAPRAPLGAQYA